MELAIKIIVLAWLAIVGGILGSFACCQAHRLHERAEGRKLGKRSVCLSCKKPLRWYDNLPIVSWIALKGRCRYCKAKIGKAEILSEILLAAVFLLTGLKFYDTIALQPQLAVGVLVLLALFTSLFILAIYDAKWGELPTGILILTNILAIIYLVATAWAKNWQIDLFSVLISIGILAGTYYLLYFFSREKLVGGGDWILCLAIAIALLKWESALVELFLANFLTLIAALPTAVTKKQKQFPFGPFLVAAFVIIKLVF